MDVEIAFPLAFVVHGTPVSFQAARSRSLVEWQEEVRKAISPILPEAHFLARQPLAVTILYFPAVRMQGDLDNIIKPILDAMTEYVYLDDSQIEQIYIRRFQPDAQFAFTSRDVVLDGVLAGPRPALYVRLSSVLLEGELP